MARLSRSLVPILLLPLIQPTGARAQIQAVRIASGLNFPVYGTTPPGDASRLFVLEQAGVVRLIKDGALLAQPFLDVTSMVTGGGEQGLLGLAFHPDYATNGLFYVYFIEGAGAGSSTILRYNVSANPDSADENSSFRVFNLTQPFCNHNGGTITFGADGFLYFGLGDGGSAGDPANRAQNGMDLLGKMLRLDVDGPDAYPTDPMNNYAIPAGNPFVGDGSVRDEIWDLGLRNPYRFGFDRLTGDLWIGDVGQDCFEEISFSDSTGGHNFGWDIMEGPDCYNEMPIACNQGPCGTGLVDPVHWIMHPAGLVAVTGGYRYRGRIAAIQGEYFFAEFFSAAITSVKFDGTAVTDTTDWTATLDPPDSDINQIASFAEDADGELYIVDAGGEVFKIVIDPTYVGPQVTRPTTFGIGAVRPNPFRDTASFDVTLDREADLTVAVYSAAGRLIRKLHEGAAPAGVLPLQWRARSSGRELPAGVYFVRAEADGRVDSARVVLLR